MPRNTRELGRGTIVDIEPDGNDDEARKDDKRCVVEKMVQRFPPSMHGMCRTLLSLTLFAIFLVVFSTVHQALGLSTNPNRANQMNKENQMFRL